MSEFTKVTCHLNTGLVLRTFQETKGPFDTVSHLEKGRFELRPGPNDVPREFMNEWLSVNSDSHFVKKHFIEIERN